MACGGEVDYAVFQEKPVYMGLDLSARNDLTALALVAKDADNVWHARCEFFSPEANVMERSQRDRAPYDVWADQGYIMLTPGASIAYEWVAQRLVELCEEYDVRVIAFDRWRIDVLKAELERMGYELPLEPFGQGFKDMAPALDIVESEISNCTLRHGDNPVLTWCAANAIVVADPTGNRKLDKSKSTGRIDGMVALAMAMGRTMMDNAVAPNPYADHDLRVIHW